MRLAGLGALYERFARLKARLEAAGWFAAERKRPLPRVPARASASSRRARAAALRDVLTTLRRRWPALRDRALSRGRAGRRRGAGHRRARSRRPTRAPRSTCSIVCRGGGSIEDLWAFNEEAARARGVRIARCRSCQRRRARDRLHDLRLRRRRARADAHRAAATLVAPDRAALLAAVDCAELARWRRAPTARALGARMQRARQRVAPPGASGRAARAAGRARVGARDAPGACAAPRASTREAARGRTAQQRLLRELRAPLPRRAHGSHSRARCAAALRRERTSRRLDARVAALAQNLAHLNPRAVLERGYASSRRDGGTSCRMRAMRRGDVELRMRAASAARSSRESIVAVAALTRSSGARRWDAATAARLRATQPALGFVRIRVVDGGCRARNLRDDIRAAPAPRCAACATTTSRVLRAMAQRVVHQHQRQHRLGDRRRADADARDRGARAC